MQSRTQLQGLVGVKTHPIQKVSKMSLQNLVINMYVVFTLSPSHEFSFTLSPKLNLEGPVRPCIYLAT